MVFTGTTILYSVPRMKMKHDVTLKKNEEVRNVCGLQRCTTADQVKIEKCIIIIIHIIIIHVIIIIIIIIHIIIIILNKYAHSEHHSNKSLYIIQ